MDKSILTCTLSGIILSPFVIVAVLTYHISVPIQVQAKDSKPVLPTGLPIGPKASKPQTMKSTSKATKKQDAGKKNNEGRTTGDSRDKNDKTKPQVTHELSMVC